MERACSDHVCSSRQSPCMCLLLGHNAYTLGIQKHIMCCLFPEGMKTTMTHKVIHHSNLCGAPHFRNRSDPRFVATKATIVGHLWGTDRPPPWHLRTGPHSLKPETRFHAKLIPRKTTALQRCEESLSDTPSGDCGRALKHSSGLWDPIFESYGFPQRSP